MEGSDASAHSGSHTISSNAQLPTDAPVAVRSSRSTPSETLYTPKRSSSVGATSAFAAAAAVGAVPASDVDAGSGPTVRRLSGYSGVITWQSSSLLSIRRASSSGDTMPARRSPLRHVT